MKKFTISILLLIVLSLFWTVNAQVNLYTFASSSGTYVPVSSGTPLIAAAVDDANSSATDIGFDFLFNGSNFTQFVANSNGNIRLGSANPTGAYSPISTTSNTNAISFFGRDGKTGGAVVYELSGTAPDRVLTIEYPNFNPSYSNATNVISAQIKLYETTNVVEFIYGSSATTSTYTAQVGIRGSSATTDFNNRTTTTDWSATLAGSTSSATVTFSSSVFPASGQTFTFSPPVAGTPEPPVNPSPANLAADVPVDGSLTWDFGANTATYDLWFGPSGSMVEVVSGATADVSGSYPYSGILNSQNYQWQVIEHNGELTTNGPVWSFMTVCGVYAVPFTESFSADLGCWSFAEGTSGASKHWGTATADASHGVSAPKSGTHFARLDVYNASTTYNPYYFISPSFLLDGADKQLSYFYWLGSSGYQLSPIPLTVQITTDDGANWVTLYEHTSLNSTFTSSSSVTGWTQNTIGLGSYAGETVAFRFVSQSNYGSGYTNQALDEFTIEDAPDCLPPSGLTATNITTNSAELGWTENGTATTWNIEFGDADFIPTGVATYTTQENPFLIEDLVSATPYDFYVQADCGAKAASPWVGPFTFTTLCDVYAVPFTEDFSADLGCWSFAEGASGAPVHWGTATADASHGVAAPKSGTHFARLDVYNATTAYNPYYLISPSFLLDGPAKQLNYFYWLGSGGYHLLTPVPLTVEISTDDGANWTMLYEHTSANSTFTGTSSIEGWTENTIGLGSYTGETVKFRFVSQSNWGSGFTNQGIDEFIINDIPPPGTVSGIVTETISGDPIQDVTVTAEPGGLQATTNAMGEYSLELDAGQYDLTFENGNYYPYTGNGVVVVSEETTTLDVSLDLLDVPYCADVVAPADNDFGILPDISLEWAPADGSAPPSGYRILLYNITTDEWIENETDLGNVTSYTPVVPFDWGCQYVWLIKPYNNTGDATDCIPWYFTTAFSGMIDGNVLDTQSGLPVEGVSITLEEVFPNAGFSMDFTTDAAGNWDVEWETGIYNIYFWKFGYLAKTLNNVSIFANQTTVLNITLDPVVPFTIPFVEDWTAPKPWSVTGENWYTTSTGNPSNSAMFYYDPQNFDYQQDLYSFYIDGRDESKVYAQFDLFLNNYGGSAEYLSFMVFDGEQWNVIETYDNLSGYDIPWTTMTFDITEYAAGKQFLIGFRAEGEDTWGIDWWLIDNILVTNSIMEVEPLSIYDALFPGETSVWDIDIMNYGNGDLNWNAELILSAPWAVLSQTTGVGAPGLETIQLTFDASAVVAGHYEAEIIFSDEAGVFQKSVALVLDTYADPGQKIMIPEANEWGYISSYVNMDGKMTLEEAMADILDEMIIMIGKTGVFWPAQNINTLGNWNTYEGYKLKMAEKGLLAYVGAEVTNKTVSFDAGTYIIPVLSTEPVSVESIFLNQPVDFAFSLDGSIYWPAGGIQSLNQLEPGYGYLVRFSAPAVLNFSTKGQGVTNNPPKFVNNTSWNAVTKTGDVHIIGVSSEACAELTSGDVFGMFNLDGNCVGMAQYNGNGEAFAVTAFADDNTTESIDGMIENEPLTTRIFRDGNEFEVNPVYSLAMPNSDGNFAINGLSMITSLKLGATSIAESPLSAVRIYPNPSDGVFNIMGADDAIRMIVTNSQGQIIMNSQMDNSNQLDLTGQPTGIYFIKLIGNQGVKLEKVIIR